jgi:hypothetical protein
MSVVSNDDPSPMVSCELDLDLLPRLGVFFGLCDAAAATTLSRLLELPFRLVRSAVAAESKNTHTAVRMVIMRA